MATDEIDERSVANAKRVIDPLFSGFGAPALMSPKEPAICLLKQNYSESFAFTKGESRVHLFMIKVGLWALVWTFTKKDFGLNEVSMKNALTIVEDSLSGRNSSFKEMLDKAVLKAQLRLKQKADRFGIDTSQS